MPPPLFFWVPPLTPGISFCFLQKDNPHQDFRFLEKDDQLGDFRFVFWRKTINSGTFFSFSGESLSNTGYSSSFLEKDNKLQDIRLGFGRVKNSVVTMFVVRAALKKYKS